MSAIMDIAYGNNAGDLPTSQSTLKSDNIDLDIIRREMRKTPNTYENTKVLMDSFRDKTSKYPKHISLKTSVELCVLLSMNNPSLISMPNIMDADKKIFMESVPNKILDDSPIITVEFDKDKDFMICFSSRSNGNYRLNIFNEVIHQGVNPVKVMSSEVPVELEGDKITISGATGKIVMDKKTVQKLGGIESTFSDEPLPRRQAVANKNAFEIRTDIMQMAVDYGMYNKITTPTQIVDIAKMFYDFVENKNNRR